MPKTLPDVATWQPDDTAAESLHAAFERRCAGVEQLVRLRATLEREMNIHNFDSGPGVEDIVREELRKLLPLRYAVTSGVINDQRGRTAGDFDIILFNDLWFTAVKSGATPQSRRVHFPIEGVYGVCEVKQSLSIDTLDAAMEKLVKSHRLYRPMTSPHRLTENREGRPCPTGLTNPLFSGILATDLAPGTSLDEVQTRFFEINQLLSRLEVVRSLCIMGHGTQTWGVWDVSGEDPELRPAFFMNRDLGEPIAPVFHVAAPGGSALFPFVADLQLHLFHSILPPEDIGFLYGSYTYDVQVPLSPSQWLEPDPGWFEARRGQNRCKHGPDEPGTSSPA